MFTLFNMLGILHFHSLYLLGKFLHPCGAQTVLFLFYYIFIYFALYLSWVSQRLFRTDAMETGVMMTHNMKSVCGGSKTD